MARPTHTKKLSADSRFAVLTDEQRQKLAETLLMGQRSLEEIRQWLAGLGVEVSIQAISNYHRRWVVPQWSRGMNSAAVQLDAIGSEHSAGAAHNLMRQRVFELMTTPGVDMKLVAEMYRAMIAGEKSEQDARRLTLLEQRAAAADAAKAALEQKAAAGGVSKETMELIEEQLKLL